MDTMRSLLYRFVWNALGLFLLAKGIYDDGVQIGGLSAAAGVVLLLSLAQAFVRPASSSSACDLSHQFADFGFASFVAGLVLNALVFFAIGQTQLISGFHVRDFWAALGMTVLYSLVNAVGAMLFGRRE